MLFVLVIKDSGNGTEHTLSNPEMVRSWEEWLTDQVGVLPFRGTLAGWTNGQTGNS